MLFVNLVIIGLMWRGCPEKTEHDAQFQFTNFAGGR